MQSQNAAFFVLIVRETLERLSVQELFSSDGCKDRERKTKQRQREMKQFGREVIALSDPNVDSVLNGYKFIQEAVVRSRFKKGLMYLLSSIKHAGLKLIHSCSRTTPGQRE